MTNNGEDTSAFDSIDEAIAEYLQLHESGIAPPRDEFLARYPALEARLSQFFADFDRVGRDASKFRLPNSDMTQTYGSSTSTNLTTVRYLGDYELLEEIARGGMGVVFKARQVSLNRTVALKMILAGSYATPQAVQRFRAEAEAAANLDHPNILPIYEVGEHEGHQYFSMKLIEGPSLSGHSNGKAHDPRQLALLMTTLARGIQYAHQRGILHRDLKPANILLDRDGTPYVTDFGLARKVDADDGSTRTGSIVGTPSYMAPEQARGEKGLTTAVDIYSLGAILYEQLTGHPPFRGETVFATVKQVMEQDPSDPRALNPNADRDLSVIALKCLKKAPAERYATAGDLADDLQRWTRGEPILARESTRAERAAKWVRRNPMVASLVSLLTLVILGGSTLIFLKYLEASRLRTVAVRKAEDEAEARLEAERAEEKSRVRLVRSYLERASPHILAGEVAKSLPWITAAFQQEPNDELHRLRLTLALQRFPTVIRFLEKIEHAEFIGDDQILAHGPDGIRCTNWKTEQTIWGPISLSKDSAVASEMILSPDEKRVALFEPALQRCRVFNVANGQPASPLLIYPVYADAHQRKADALAPIFSTDGTKVSLMVHVQTNREDYAQWGQVLDVASGRAIGPLLKVQYQDRGGLFISPTFDHWYAALAKIDNIDYRGVSINVISGEKIAMQDLHGKDFAWHARISPDGRFVSESNYENENSPKTGVWSLADGKRVMVPGSKDGWLNGVSAEWAPDGSTIMTHAKEGVVIHDGKTFARQGLRPMEADFTRISPNPQWAVHYVYPADEHSAVFFNTRDPENISRPGGLEYKIDYQEVRNGSFSPDGELFASVANDGHVIVWQSSSSRPWTPPLPHNGTVKHARFSRDLRYLLTSGRDARIWDLTTLPLSLNEPRGGCLGTMKPNWNADRILMESPNKTLTSLDADGGIRCQFFPTGRWTNRTLSQDGKRILFFSPHTPDGKLVRRPLDADQQYFQLWNADADGKPLGPVFRNDDSEFDLSPDGSRIVATKSIIPPGPGLRRKTGQLLIRDAMNGTVLHRLQGREDYRVVGFSSSENVAIVLCSRGILYDDKDQIGALQRGDTIPNDAPEGFFIERIALATGRTLEGRFEIPGEYRPRIIMSPTGSHLVVGEDNKGPWRLYETATGKLLQDAIGLRGIRRDSNAILKVGLQAPTDLEFSRDGRTILAATFSGEKEVVFRCWNSEDGQPLGSQETIQDEGTGLASTMHPTNRMICIPDYHQHYLLVDRRFGLPIARGPSHFTSASFAFSFRGDRLIVTDSREKQGWVSLQPDTRSLGTLSIWSQFLSGATLDDQGRLHPHDDETMRDLWRQIQSTRKPGAEDALDAKSSWLRDKANLFESRSQPVAIDALTQLIAMQPERLDWVERRGLQHLQLKQYRDALADLERLLKQQRPSDDFLKGGIEAHLSLKQYADAEKLYALLDDWRWDSTNDDDNIYQRLNNLIRLGEVDLFRMRMGEELESINVAKLYFNNHAIAVAGHVPDVPGYARLLPFLIETTKTDDNHYLKISLAWMLYRNGRAQDALPVIRKVMDMDSDVPSLHYLLAACERAAGTREAAIKALANGDKALEKLRLSNPKPESSAVRWFDIPLIELFRKEVATAIDAGPDIPLKK